MSSSKIPVHKLKKKLLPDIEWTVIKPFVPGGSDRILNIIDRVMDMDEDSVKNILARVLEDHGHDHRRIDKKLLKHFDLVRNLAPSSNINEERKMLIGAFFTHEYSLQSAALFNPSIVIHPNQKEDNDNTLRFVMSMRAVGEGHISSVVFRQGMVIGEEDVKLKRPSRYISVPENIHALEVGNKNTLVEKLSEIGEINEFMKTVLETLPVSFSEQELRENLINTQETFADKAMADESSKEMINLCFSNYRIEFDENIPLSERSIFPFCSIQSGGIEDVRFVRFKEENNEYTYYGTYTAYNGRDIQPQLIETRDFCTFNFLSLYGKGAKNKGMALFPEKIDGRYAMISRLDNENMFLMFSDQINIWNKYNLLLKPKFSWEYIQIGNCGSPIETDAGWLVLSHGVGAMREYSLGAFLLDKKNPQKVLGRLPEPLIKPVYKERDGYVPNVVYTCGALKVRETLVIPYSISDYSTGFALAKIRDIIDAMV